MPDDAAPPLRTAASDHATRLREERSFMRVGNISRSQARQALRGWAAERLQAQQIAALAGIPIPKQSSEPIISTETQSFRPQPMTLGQLDISGGGGSGPATPETVPVLNLRGRFLIETGGVVSVETIDFTGEVV